MSLFNFNCRLIKKYNFAQAYAFKEKVYKKCKIPIFDIDIDFLKRKRVYMRKA